jgi:hypothetical protein
VSPELIGGLVLAITGLIASISSILSKRSEDRREELDQLRNDYRMVRQQLRYADQWIFRLSRCLDQNGIEAPKPPDGLELAPAPEENS